MQSGLGASIWGGPVHPRRCCARHVLPACCNAQCQCAYGRAEGVGVYLGSSAAAAAAPAGALIIKGLLLLLLLGVRN